MFVCLCVLCVVCEYVCLGWPVCLCVLCAFDDNDVVILGDVPVISLMCGVFSMLLFDVQVL